MPYVLDTDTVTALQRRHRNVVAHAQTLPDADIFVTIVSFEEQMVGRLAELNRQSTPAGRVFAYRNLSRTLRFFATTNVLPYTDDAARVDDNLRAAFRRMGTKDRRIAAITLARGYTLVTRNTVDFQNVPGLSLEDWMAP